MNTESVFKSMECGPNPTADAQDTWTVLHAAHLLNRPPRSVRRLLQRGTIKGYKIPGRFGDEWRVYPFDPTETAQRLCGESDLVTMHSTVNLDSIFPATEKENDQLSDQQLASDYLSWRLQSTLESCEKLDRRTRLSPWHRLVMALREFFRILVQQH